MTADRAASTIPTIGIIHATLLSFDPIQLALREVFPEAQRWNVLDDSLMRELRDAGGLTPKLEARMERIISHLVEDGVDAVQFACSSFSSIVERADGRLPIPVRKPDEAMYRELAEEQGSTLGIVATLPGALDLAVEQLREVLGEASTSTPIVTRCIPEALAAAERGEDETACDVVTAAVAQLRDEGAHVVAFAQYSLTPYAARVKEATGVDVRTGPHAAARDLRNALNEGARR
jgi:aspartate/glutamate racemase